MPSETEYPEEQRRPPRIVVVEDDAALLAVLTQLLEVDGYDLVGHTGLENTVALVRDAQTVAVVVDLGLTASSDVAIDTRCILDRLRFDPLTRNTPLIIACAGREAIATWQPALAESFQVLRKPYDVDELLAALETAARRKERRQSAALLHTE